MVMSFCLSARLSVCRRVLLLVAGAYRVGLYRDLVRPRGVITSCFNATPPNVYTAKGIIRGCGCGNQDCASP